MKAKQKAKGSWGVRFFIVLLAMALGVLLFWLLSFLEQDIGRLKGPEKNVVRAEFIDASQDQQQTALLKDIQHQDHKIKTLNEQLQNLQKSTRNYQNTINQLLPIQRQSIEQKQEFPAESQKALNAAQSGFLDNQTLAQRLNQQISDLTLARQDQQTDLSDLNEQLKPLEQKFNEQWNRRLNAHRLKVAVIKLAVLIPIFLIFSFLFMKYRNGAYWSLVWAAFGASFIKIATVAHTYFPRPYFKYIATLVILGIVLRMLVYLIKTIVAPRKDLLVKQYQQLYDKCLCPVCGKPIRTGPLRYIGGLKKKMQLPTSSAAEIIKPQPYTCPSCGSNLYHKCDNCGGIRHTLLPYCEHCGHERKP